MASAGSHSGSLLGSVPCSLSDAAKTALFQLGKALLEDSHDGLVGRMSVECFLALELMPNVVPVLKGVIKESCIDYGDDKMYAASAKAPVGSAVLAALQPRWLVTQVQCTFLESCVLLLFLVL